MKIEDTGIEIDFTAQKKKKSPLIASGPCSAETEEQVMETAKALKQIGVQLFRAGIWKPRTMPGGFEGVGEPGLKWLQKVKEETGMQVATEVANATHVNLALKYGIDALWIGARTSANPFAVQEIADSLRGRNITVMVKNPVNPDAALWQGAIQRFLDAGITNISAIHRGFSSYGFSEYRNPPHWQVAVELKQRLPEIPLLCDPSHMGGKRDLIEPLSQKALDLNYDGLFIESHSDPDNALSDKKQQVTPGMLHNILNNLVIREEKLLSTTSKNELDELRNKIDMIDDELISILKERMKVAEEIGNYKKQNGMTILQQSRWGKILQRLNAKAEATGLGGGFLEEIFKSIHQESINHQEKIMRAD